MPPEPAPMGDGEAAETLQPQENQEAPGTAAPHDDQAAPGIATPLEEQEALELHAPTLAQPPTLDVQLQHYAKVALELLQAGMY